MTENPNSDRTVTVPAPNSDQFTERIREVIGQEKVRAFARRAGIGATTLQNIVDGARPTVDKLVAIARAGGVTVDWLATGVGPMRPADAAARGLADAPAAFSRDDLVGRGFVLIPRYDVAASAGPGAFADSEQVADYMAFREEFVRRTLRVDPANLALITAVGDSMEPAIRAGDLLLIDRGVDRILDDAIYVLVKRGELVVKRVQQFFNGAVAVKSDNAAYVEETLGPDEADQIRVAGRVRWIGRLI